MICPVCKHEIPDTSIICPLCNTQFAFSAPDSIQSSNSEVYEVVENKNVLEETFSPSENVVPTEVSHGPEEEINPDSMTYFVDESKNQNEEYMHINGQQIGISDETYNPSAVVNTPPIRTEIPNSAVNINDNVAQVNNVNNNMSQVNGQVQMQARPPVNNMVTADGVGVGGVNNQMPITSPTMGQSVNISNEPTNVNVLDTVGVVDEKYVQDKEKQRQKENIFFIVVIIFGVAVLLLIAVMMMINPKKSTTTKTTKRVMTTQEIPSLAETKNIGNRSSFNYPMYVGNTTVASFFDQSTKGYTDVDVTGLRFFTGVEAQELANSYGNEQLKEGFTWFGFEYKVQLNDLDYLNGRKVNPALNAKFYKYNGCDFIVFNEHNYLINVITATNEQQITNGQSAVVKVIYQLPASEGEYSICLGYLGNSIG
ncbi:MAG: hypothetical protein K2G03_06610, partial [Bacilli bacterium]|nr:hypothetical protein [Bacilli bacterium]